MDKSIPRNPAPRVRFVGIKNTCSRTIGNATGKQMEYFPELDPNAQAREYWVDYQRFGTVKRTGTLEEFFRQRKEQRE